MIKGSDGPTPSTATAWFPSEKGSGRLCRFSTVTTLGLRPPRLQELE